MMTFTDKNIKIFFLMVAMLVVVYAKYHFTVTTDTQLCKWLTTKNESCTEVIRYTAFVDVAFDVINLMIN